MSELRANGKRSAAGGADRRGRMRTGKKYGGDEYRQAEDSRSRGRVSDRAAFGTPPAAGEGAKRRANGRAGEKAPRVPALERGKRARRAAALLIPALLSAALAALLLSGTKRAPEHVKNGLELVFLRVTPSVFPYLVLTGIITRSGASETLGRLLGKPFSLVFRLPPACVSALILGLIAGFPLGAQSAAGLYEAGVCGKKDAERLLSFCNFCGPPYILGVIGQGLFGSVRLGVLIYLAQTLVALVFGALYLRRQDGRCPPDAPQCAVLPGGAPPAVPSSARKDAPPAVPAKREGLLTMLTGAIGDAGSGMLRVGSFVLFFYLVSCALIDLLADIPVGSPAFLPLLSGALELSTGVSFLSAFNAPSTTVKLVLAVLILGFSGISVMMQTAGFALRAGLSMRGYLLAHILCPPFTALLTVCAARIAGIL